LGIGVEKDETKAFEYCKNSAEKKCVDAQFQLSECYRLGIGIEKDKSKAFEYCKESAKKGHHMAQYNLGFYMKMVKVQKNI